MQAAAELQGTISSGGGGDTAKAPKHVFAALQYLRKLCSHPLLALEAEQHPSEAVKSITQFAAEVLAGPASKLGAAGTGRERRCRVWWVSENGLG